MSHIDEQLHRHIYKQYSYQEPEEIRLEPAFTEEYKAHFRWVMVRRFKALLQRKINEFRP